jgi:hypothetical protein
MDELLNELGKFIVAYIKVEMAIPRNRFTKRGDMPKSPSRYNFIGTGQLQKSVSYTILDDELVVLMEDYGVEYVFSDLAQAQTGGDGGSWPGGGKFYPDRRKPGTKAKFSPLIQALTKWAKSKLKLPEADAKSMAFAVRKNLFKAGYKGLPLFTEEFNTAINQEIDRLLVQDKYSDIFVDEVLEKVETLRVFGNQTFNIAIG